jgi:RNA polymerase-binding transcription factor DksA
MNPAKIAKYRGRLEDMLRRLVGNIERMIEAVHEESVVPGEHDREPSETVDKEVWLEQNEQALHAEVVAALDRIEKGAFGHCEDCGIELPEARLDVVPYTRWCVRCEQKHEAQEARAASRR